MNQDHARVLQSLEQGTEGFNGVLDRLDGVDEQDDFVRFEQEELRVMLGEESPHRGRLSASD